MNDKHTPGPWRVGNDKNVRGDWSCYDDDAKTSTTQPITDGAGNVLAFVADSTQGYKERQSFNSDARLIAAAPALLQELINIAYADTVEWDDRSEFEAWAKNRARAAIAKATGGNMTTTEELAEKLRTGRVLTTEGSPLQEAASRLLEQEQEIERLNASIKWEQHYASRVGTHGEGCERWGQRTTSACCGSTGNYRQITNGCGCSFVVLCSPVVIEIGRQVR